jgi:hypothetical protein
MNDRVIKYFNAIAEKLASEHLISSTIKNSSDIGYARENLVRKFLANHLPGRLSAVLGGHVFGFNQDESKQLDILILNDLGLNFKENEKPFAPVENVGAIVSVKSTLDSNSLVDALTNIASVPQIDPDIMDFVNLPGEPFGFFTKLYPRFIVFAYTGMSLDSSLATIKDFYDKNSTPPNRIPNAIIVNKEYYIQYNPEPILLLNGRSFPAHTFNGMNLEKRLYGYPLFHILGPLNGYSSWLTNMRLDYSKYFNVHLQHYLADEK